LPDALRVLLVVHPRARWEGDPYFNDLTRFWLDRHLMFRRLQGMLVAETERFLDRRQEGRAFGGQIVRLGQLYLTELHGHHTIEDVHYFPLLKGLDARLGAGFELLDSDHQAMDAGLRRLAEAANAVLTQLRAAGAPVQGGAEALRKELLGFGRLLDRHLTDEEELVVPVILEHKGAGLG